LKLVTKRSLQHTHISQASGSGVDEGTGSIPGVFDVPTDESEEEISWNSTDKEGDDDEAKDGNGDDDDNGDDGATPPKPKASVQKTRSSSDTTITPPTAAAGPRLTTFEKDKQAAKAFKAKNDDGDEDNDDDNQEDEGDDGEVNEEDKGGDNEQASDKEEFIHPSLSTHTKEETRDEESFDPILKTPKNSDDEGNGPVAGNQIARRVIDDLVDFNGETSGRRDDVRDEQARLGALNDCITQAKEQIEIKKDHVRVMEAEANDVREYYPASVVLGIVRVCYRLEFGEDHALLSPIVKDIGVIKWVVMSFKFPCRRFKGFKCCYLYLSEVAESLRLGDKMKYVFGRSRSEDESLGSLMRNLYSALRVSLSNKRRLVAELEALGELEGASKSLEHMGVIVGRDEVTLEALEAFWACAQVGAALKLSEVAESLRLGDKMKYVFGRSRSEDESLGSLMRNLYSALRVSLSNKRRLVAELEALGELEGASKSLEHMEVIVGRDEVTLGALEAFWACAQVEAALKVGFVANMEVQE
nr:hypothetical protein [Tanacetum cinerariifolium]